MEITGTLERSPEELINACKILLEEEQEKPLPNNALVAVLCDTVRMARQYETVKEEAFEEGLTLGQNANYPL